MPRIAVQIIHIVITTPTVKCCNTKESVTQVTPNKYTIFAEKYTSFTRLLWFGLGVVVGLRIPSMLHDNHFDCSSVDK